MFFFNRSSRAAAGGAVRHPSRRQLLPHSPRRNSPRSSSRTILSFFFQTMGQNSWWGARLLISLVEFQSLNILRLIAFTEIIMMPLTVLFVLM
jgi:hypothetical protein